MEIKAEPGEQIHLFAERMIALREFTDEDFDAVHNDRKVTVVPGMRRETFVEEWDEVGGVFTLANVLLPAIQGTVYHDCTWDEALSIAHRIRHSVKVVTP